MADSLLVHEIYLSLQGESTFAGLPCAFVRLTGCDLRCSYCDTAYAFTGGQSMTIDEIIAELQKQCDFAGETGDTLPLVEITGGEPLLQKNVHTLMRRLCDMDVTVLVETSGAHDIGASDPRVRHIMDWKCPSSGEAEKMFANNITLLKPSDEVKFVLGTAEDYDWAKAQLTEYRLSERCPVLFSWVAPLQSQQQDESLKPAPADHTPITRRELVECIIRDKLRVRYQLQMHKFIWPPDEQGV
ncbi:MAG: radical SAM protein [Verrucomicrobiota bacterium]|nr:radical SAM protein [Verrucomicrobiota bacterium]